MKLRFKRKEETFQVYCTMSERIAIMKLSFMSEMIAESVWRAMGRTCGDTKAECGVDDTETLR